MSLQSDLTRNRTIFEVLTGAAAAADSAERSSARASRGIPVRECAESARHGQELSAECLSDSAQSFSLKRGEVREAGTALSFEAPGDVDYPKLGEPVPKTPPDALESLYHQLDVQARMSSQLFQEEEF